MSSQVVYAEAIKSLANGSIGAGYVAVGTAFSHPIRIAVITNGTDGDMLFSLDGSTDHFYLAAGNAKLLDLTGNRDRINNLWVFPSGTQFYVKQSTAPSSGSVFVEGLYGG